MRAPNAVDQFASYGSTEEPVDNHDGKRVLGLVPLSEGGVAVIDFTLVPAF